MDTLEGPFGPATLIEQLDPAVVETMYRDKCGAVVDFGAIGVDSLDLYRCDTTGMRFWRPEKLAGDEAFYQELSAKWPFYYRDWRWEYGPALAGLRAGDRLLEVGCGRGYFLRWTEGRVKQAEGLEFNREAIADKVTSWPVHPVELGAMAAQSPGAFDVVCGFQVLEHVVDPAQFLRDCVTCLRPGGRLVISTPDPENRTLANRQDAFDLPPHHVSHLSLDSYRRIAELLGLELLKVDRAPLVLWAVRPPGAPRPGSAINAAMSTAKNLAARMLRRRGHTLMVTMRKPGRG